MTRLLTLTLAMALTGAVNASECGTGSCGANVGINDTDSNSIYNDQLLAPTVTQAATNVNNYVAGNSNSVVAGTSCANASLSISAGASQSQFGSNINTQHSDNYTVGVVYSVPLGGSNNTCEKYQKLQLRELERNITKEEITNCIGLVKAVDEGYIKLSFVLQQPMCRQVLVQGSQGYHGQELQRLTQENQVLRSQLQQAIPVRK